MRWLSLLFVFLASPALADMVSVSITRPNNTTTYTVSTGWSTSTSTGTATSLAAPAGSTFCLNTPNMFLTDAIIIDGANQNTKLTGILHIFNQNVGTPIADNAAFNLTTADSKNRTAIIPFTLTNVDNAGLGAAGIQSVTLTNLQILHFCKGTPNIMIEVTNAYVPVANEVLTVILKYAPLYF